MTRYRKIAGVGVVVLLLGGGLLYGAWKAGRADAAKPQRPPAVPVEVARVTLGAITSGVSVVGTVEARRDVVVSSEAAGRVVEVYVDVGDRVTQGMIIAEVDSELRRLAVEHAEAQLALAKANAQKAERDLKRNRPLFAQGDVAAVEMEGIRLAAQSAESAFRSAEVALKVAQRQLADTKVRSPIAGTVARRFVEVGETVGPGAPVANVVDLDVVRVKLTIPEEEIGGVVVGQKARATMDPYPGVTFEGKVVNVGSKAEGNSHRYPVDVEVANSEDRPLKAGMFARTEVVTATHERIPLIPTTALIDGTSQPSVYVVQNDRAVLRPVSLSGRQGDLTAVAEGLQEGDLVVTMGQRMLRDGTAVEVR
jgi:membrane fusion protein (multidrug efflux system)